MPPPRSAAVPAAAIWPATGGSTFPDTSVLWPQASMARSEGLCPANGRRLCPAAGPVAAHELQPPHSMPPDPANQPLIDPSVFISPSHQGMTVPHPEPRALRLVPQPQHVKEPPAPHVGSPAPGHPARIIKHIGYICLPGNDRNHSRLSPPAPSPGFVGYEVTKLELENRPPDRLSGRRHAEAITSPRPLP